MRGSLLALVILVGCADPNVGARADAKKLVAEHRARQAEARAKDAEDRARLAEQRSNPSTPTKTATAETPQKIDCGATRARRVQEAKDAINAWNVRVKELAPLAKFAVAHKCELRDNTGTVLVTKKREAGGVRVSVKRGEADEVVCDTTKIPEGLDAETMRLLAILAETAEDDVMFSTIPECDDRERPSLRVRYNDEALQKAILALP